MEKMNWNIPELIKNWRTLKMEQKRTLLSVLIIGTAVLLFTVAVIIGIASCAGKARTANTDEDALLPIPELLKVPTAQADEPDAENIEPDEPAEPENTDPDSGEQDGADPEDYGENDPTGTDNPSGTDDPGSEYEQLKKHDKGEAVTRLQTRLMELGYLEIDETTDYFGSSTEYAVELFQRQHELKQNGVAGVETQKLLYSKDAQKYTLKEGAEGRDVKMLQEQLVDLGYLSESDVDRVYGPTTVEAVKAFQKRNGLSADGLAGEKTLDKLYSDEAKISKTLEEKEKAEEKAAKEKEKKEKQEGKKATPTPVSKKETRIEKFIKVAQSKIGCEYVLGGRGPKVFDCSGFVFYCLKQCGVSTIRLTASGFSKKSAWKNISSYSDVQKGDILFFKSDTSSSVSHCGIYIGGGMMIDASSGNEAVVKRAVSAYWKRNFVNARRPWG